MISRSCKVLITRGAALLAVLLLASPLAVANETEMIRVAGTPTEIGAIWGEMNRDIIIRDMEVTYLERAADEGISEETLIERSADFVRIAEEIAPHWLEEGRAIARAAGVDEDLYIAFMDGQARNRFLHEDPEECTSYAVSRDHARDGAILFHKTRDNIDRPQMAPLVDSSLEDVNKFIAITDGSRIRCSMMINDKGLAGAGDYPADRKTESSTLELPPAEPRYRGLMAGTILRYIAERASSSTEALEIIEEFVDKGYYAGGNVGGSHWLFVDRDGVILEVCNNAEHVVSKVHTQDVYFSRYNERSAAQRLREADEVDFELFRGVSRDPSILTGQSISGLTVEIHPDHPETLTTAWIALPVRSVAFPVLLGQDRAPAPLVDGSAYALGQQSPEQESQWEDLERSMHAEVEELRQMVAEGLSAGDSAEEHVETLEQWSANRAAMLVDALEESAETTE